MWIGVRSDPLHQIDTRVLLLLYPDYLSIDQYIDGVKREDQKIVGTDTNTDIERYIHMCIWITINKVLA